MGMSNRTVAWRGVLAVSVTETLGGIAVTVICPSLSLSASGQGRRQVWLQLTRQNFLGSH